MSAPKGGMFRSLRNPNYRLWIGAALISNIGTWMQATAQDWLVLTELTHNSARAVGFMTALQFAPQLLLVPVTGMFADRLDRRKLLIVTQSGMGLLALLLGLLTVSGHVLLWQVYFFGLLLGVGMAFDTPARQSFVSELVGEADIGNAVALNGTTFNLARTVGPAVAGLSIAAIGTGWVFIVNAASFLAVIAALIAMNVVDLHRSGSASGRGAGGLLEGFRYLRRRPDILVILAMLFLIGGFGLNFAVFIAAMAVNVFRVGASEYGFLSSILATGAVAGALLAARRERPSLFFLLAGALLFGCAMTLAALMPNFLLFGAMLMIVGVAVPTVLTTANGLVQLSVDRGIRGRVMAIYAAIMLGGMPIGAPIVGWVADHAGPRWSVGIGAAAGFLALLIGLAYITLKRGFRLGWQDGRLDMSIAPDPYRPD